MVSRYTRSKCVCALAHLDEWKRNRQHVSHTQLTLSEKQKLSIPIEHFLLLFFLRPNPFFSMISFALIRMQQQPLYAFSLSLSVALRPIALWILVYTMYCILHSWVMMLSLGNKYVNNGGYKGIKSNGFHQMQWPNYYVCGAISATLPSSLVLSIQTNWYWQLRTIFVHSSHRTKDSLALSIRWNENKPRDVLFIVDYNSVHTEWIEHIRTNKSHFFPSFCSHKQTTSNKRARTHLAYIHNGHCV